MKTQREDGLRLKTVREGSLLLKSRTRKPNGEGGKEGGRRREKERAAEQAKGRGLLSAHFFLILLARSWEGGAEIFCYEAVHSGRVKASF